MVKQGDRMNCHNLKLFRVPPLMCPIPQPSEFLYEQWRSFQFVPLVTSLWQRSNVPIAVRARYTTLASMIADGDVLPSAFQGGQELPPTVPLKQLLWERHSVHGIPPLTKFLDSFDRLPKLLSLSRYFLLQPGTPTGLYSVDGMA